MMSRLRALEHALVRERVELGVQAAVDDLVARWERAGDQRSTPPVARSSDYSRVATNAISSHRSIGEPIEFIRSLALDLLPLPTGPRALDYLNGCRRRNTAPNPRTLVAMLLPWREPPSSFRYPHALSNVRSPSTGSG